MKKLKLYIDTSVLGGLFDKEEPKRVSTAESLVKMLKEGVCEGFISYLTVEEVLKAPENIMDYKPIEIISPEEVVGYGEVEI